MFLNPESFLIFLHFLFQLRGQTGADETGLNSIRMRLSAGHTSICLTPPVLEHWERTVMDFSARSISLHAMRRTSRGRMPAKIKSPIAGRHSLYFGNFAVLRRFFICGIDSGEISFSITLRRSTNLIGLRSHHSRRNANSNNPWSIMRALLNWLGVEKVSDSNFSQSCSLKSEKLRLARFVLDFIKRFPIYRISRIESGRKWRFACK